MNFSNDVEVFWRNYLKGFSIPTPLVVEGLRGVRLQDDDQYGKREIALDKDSFELGKHQSLFQAAWAILLARYNAAEEVVFGFASSFPVQHLSNTIPIRVHVGQDEPAAELVDRLQTLNADIGKHGAPLAEVRQWSGVAAGRPLFESLLIVSSMSSGNISNLSAILRTSGCPLVVHADLAERGTVAAFYDPRRLDADTVNRLLGHLQTLLRGIVSAPETAISRLPLMTDAERQQVLIEWNKTAAKYPSEMCLHQLFEAQAKRRPQAIAIYYKDQQITYAEVESRANQLARYLQSHGVGPEVMVGISVERSPDTVIGILGILKAGGAYVPVDPHYPKDRVAFMFADTHVPILLTQQRLLDQLPDIDATKVCLDSDWSTIAREGAAPVASNVNSENLAYVIFTSGSTGQPKGISLRHTGVVNNLVDLNTSFNVGADDKVMAISALSFDMTVYEVLGTLAAGAGIVIPEAAKQKDPAHWAELVNQHHVTVWNSAPPLLEMLVDYAEAHPERKPKSLRVTILGGDWVPVTLPNRLKAMAPNVRVIVLGGATELSIHSTVYFVDQVDPNWKSIPYGRPMANQKAYILDPNLQPLPIGVPGELHLGGVGLARGYFERPQLTAEKFIPHPFERGERIYKTADLARWLPDGNIELLGRIDHQVKIRGHRIELGEITAVLRQHSSVQDAVVIMREDVPGNKRLAAYVVPVAGRGTEKNESAHQDHAGQIDQWEAIYNETYSQTPSIVDPKQNFVGWNSSYTGLPFSEPELREMMDRTVERILALKPQRVLEIGCGTGLVLFNVAPHVKQYDGSDLSQVAIRDLKQRLLGHDFSSRVSLTQRRADDFTGVPDGVYDTVIINSVIQHFPSVDYLLRVIEGAVKKIKSTGSIFIGDIRCLSLLEAFNTSIELYRSPSSASVSQLRQRIQRRMKQEKELNIDPGFFSALAQRVAGISRVSVRPKRGVHQNEFNKFHYDIVLHIGERTDIAANVPWDKWAAAGSEVAVRDKLTRDKPAALAYKKVPNAALQKEVLAVQLLKNFDGAATVGAFRDAVNRASTNDGIPSETCRSLGEAVGYAVEISFTDDAKDGCYDVLFLRGDAAASNVIPRFACETAAARAWHEYANRPIQDGGTSHLPRQLRGLLKERLPDYMVPHDIVCLEALPLTPNGKVDRRSLPVPDQVRPDLESDYVAPRTPIEEVLAGIWCEVLGLDRIGVDDNFFELGGHSLKATQIVSRINDAFHVRTSLQSVFENPTVTLLAQALERVGKQTRTDVAQIAQVLTELNRLSEDEVDTLLAAHGNS